jgi:HK97 family phage portal protein
MGFGRAFERDAAPAAHAREGIGFTGWGTMGPVTSTEGLLQSYPGGAPWEVSGQSYMQLYRGGLSAPGAWRATRLIAGLLAQVDWDAYTTHGKDQPTLIEPRPALLEQPAPPDTRFSTLNSGMVDYLWEGNAIFVVATRDAQSKPVTVTPVPAQWCGVRRITPANASLSWLPVGELEYRIGGLSYSADEVIHVKGMAAPGGVRGWGVLEAHFFHPHGFLRTVQEQQRQAQDIAHHGVPTGLYKSGNPDLNEAGATATKQSFLRSQRERTIAVIGINDDFQPLSWNPDQMQMIESQQFSLLQLANMFDLPPSFLGAVMGGTSLTYSTVETEALSLIKFTMGAHFAQWEQTLSLALPHGTNVKADLDGFLRGDTMTRYQAYTLGIDAGWLQRSEVRRKEGLDPVKGIDALAPTAAVQLKLNKEAPVTDPAILQPRGGQFDANGQPVANDNASAHLPPKPGAPLPALSPLLKTPLPSAAPTREDWSGLAQLAGEVATWPAEQIRAVSRLPIGPGTHLWEYWLHGEGSTWKLNPHPWTALHAALLEHAVKGGLSPTQVDGLTTNLYVAAFHHMPPRNGHGAPDPASLGRH